MAPPVRTPKRKWIDAGLQALAAGGPEAVRVELLAQELGVSRGGFYGFFDDRQSLLTAMLETWERESTEDVIARVESKGGDARAKIRRAGATFSSDVMATDLAIRDWARRDASVAKRLQRVDNRRLGYLRSLFGRFCADPDDVEVRSMIAFSLVIGNHFIAADHGGRKRSQVLRMTMNWLLA